MFQPPTEYPSHYITSRSCRNKNFLAIHAATIIHQSCSWRNFARLWTRGRSVARSIVSMCFAYEIESVYVVHTERGETFSCIGDVHVCVG